MMPSMLVGVEDCGWAATGKEAKAKIQPNPSAITRSGGKPGVPSGAAPLGWRPTFLTQRFSRLAVIILIECHSNLDVGCKVKHLRVGKAGLPPLFTSSPGRSPARSYSRRHR